MAHTRAANDLSAPASRSCIVSASRPRCRNRHVIGAAVAASRQWRSDNHFCRPAKSWLTASRAVRPTYRNEADDGAAP